MDTDAATVEVEDLAGGEVLGAGTPLRKPDFEIWDSITGAGILHLYADIQQAREKIKVVGAEYCLQHKIPSQPGAGLPRE